MDWKMAENRLMQLVEVYTKDELRKMTFDKIIFPLILRLYNGERSSDLYHTIEESYKSLITDIPISHYTDNQYRDD